MMNKGKILKLAKGFRGRAKNCIRIARQRVEKGLQYAFRDRRNKKREMRSLWITRINAGTRQYGVCDSLGWLEIFFCCCACLLQLFACVFFSSTCDLVNFLVEMQVKYSELISGLQQQNIQINRKMLSELAMNEPYSFRALVNQVKFMKGNQ